MKPLMMRHLSGESIGRFPVWMMRQAGRYLPEYRCIREQHSFWEMVTTPHLASQVSLLPLSTVKVDGVIFFSDILTLPYGLGVPVTMKESIGPVIEKPLASVNDFELFQNYEPEKHTRFVNAALNDISKQLAPEMALLGFAGAPWTVASYLVEGKATRNFERMAYWMHSDPKGLTQALRMLGAATRTYLESQVQSGVHMVQLFDTWIGNMPRWYFTEFYQDVLEEIFGGLRAKKIASIYFTKHSSHLWTEFSGLSVDGLSVDNLYTLTEAEKITGGKFFLQGNLDPVLLLKGTEGEVRLRTRLLVAEARSLAKPAIINLAHGILPGTPVENAVAFIDEARVLWV